jgi:hypothetical protein
MQTKTKRSSSCNGRTRVGVTPQTRSTLPTTHLERHDHPLSNVETQNFVAKFDDLSDHFMSHGERRFHGIETKCDCGIKIAARDSNRSNKSISRSTQLWIGCFLPPQFTRTFEDEMTHVSHST